jgi:integrase
MSHRLGQIGDFWLSKNRHGRWCRTWFDTGTRQTKRLSLGTRDFDAAILALAQWVVLNEPIDKEDPKDVPLSVALDRYYEHHAKEIASADAADRAVTMLKAFFPQDMIGDLTLDRQNDFEKDLRAKGFADGYIGRIQTTLKAAVNRAYRNQEITSAPYIRVVSSDEQRDRLLSMQEAAALFNAEQSPHVFMLLILLFNTLSRPGALLQLQPSQVDFEHRLIALNPPGRKQTKKYRPTIAITDTLLPWLQMHDHRRFFVQERNTRTKPIGSCKKAWGKLRERARKLVSSIDDEVVPTTIRHTMATEMRRRGVPEWEVKGFLGHSGRGETERYAKYAPDYLAQAASAIDDYFHELQPLVKRELITNVKPLRVPRLAPVTGG